MDIQSQVEAIAFNSTKASQSINGYTTLVGMTAVLNYRSSLNTVTGAFTAPTSGVYVFGASWNSGRSTPSQAVIRFRKNSSAITPDGASATSANFPGFFHSVLVSLNAGDTVDVQFQNTQGTDTASLCSFYGYRIGGR